VDLDVELRELSLSVSIRTLFGVNVLFGGSDLGTLADNFAAAVTKPMALLFPRDLPGTPYRRALQAGDALLARLEQLVASRRRQEDTAGDALGLLLRAVDDDGHSFSDSELMPELIGLFFAGYETTAKTLSWTLYLLDRHPQILAGVLDELDEVLGGRRVRADDLPQLSQLDRVVKESMRLLPPMPILFTRVAAAQVPLGPYTLPKGANVVISPYITQRDPERYPEPRRFRPERWDALTPSVFEYMPFGAGPRVCIGANFARQSLRLILATLLQRARLSLVPNARIDYQVRALALVPKYGLPARIEAPGGRPITPSPLRGNLPSLVDLPV
jgi:cytochrome P450